MPSDLILITGSTGHLGFRVLVDALKAGYRVRAAVRSETAPKVQKIKASKEIAALNLAPDSLTFVTVPSFLVDNAFGEAIKGVKYVIHVASPIPSKDTESDYEKSLVQPAVRGTLSMLEAAVQEALVEKVVITSSTIATFPITVFEGKDTNVYDPNNRVEFTSGPYESPLAAYGASKVAALNDAEDWYRKHSPKFSLVHVHPAMVYGPDTLVDTREEILSGGSNAMLLTTIVKEQGPVFEGSAHVDDVARVHIAALRPEITGLKSFGVNVSSDYSKLGAYLQKHFPKAVEDGRLKAEPEYVNVPIKYDVTATTKALNLSYLDFEQQVKDLVAYYLKVAESS